MCWGSECLSHLTALRFLLASSKILHHLLRSKGGRAAELCCILAPVPLRRQQCPLAPPVAPYIKNLHRRRCATDFSGASPAQLRSCQPPYMYIGRVYIAVKCWKYIGIKLVSLADFWPVSRAVAPVFWEFAQAQFAAHLPSLLLGRWCKLSPVTEIVLYALTLWSLFEHNAYHS